MKAVVYILNGRVGTTISVRGGLEQTDSGAMETFICVIEAGSCPRLPAG